MIWLHCSGGFRFTFKAFYIPMMCFFVNRFIDFLPRAESRWITDWMFCPYIFDIVFSAACSGMQDRVERRGGSPLLSSERPPSLSLLPPQKHPGLHLLHHRLLLLTAEGATRWRNCIMPQPGEAGVDTDNSCCRGLIHVLDQRNNHRKFISVGCYKVM